MPVCVNRRLGEDCRPGRAKIRLRQAVADPRYGLDVHLTGASIHELNQSGHWDRRVM